MLDVKVYDSTAAKRLNKCSLIRRVAMRESQLSTKYMGAWLTCEIGTIPGTAATISFGYMRVEMSDHNASCM